MVTVCWRDPRAPGWMPLLLPRLSQGHHYSKILKCSERGPYLIMIRAGISREFLRPLVAWGALVMLPLTMCPLRWSERAPLREPITSESETRNSPEQCCPYSDVYRDQITRGPCANADLDSAGVASCQARLTLRVGAVRLQEDFPFWQRLPITSLSSSNTPSMALLCICVRPRPPPPTRSGCPALTLAYTQCGEHFMCR